MGPWPSARHRENYLGPSTQQGLAMALQTGCTEIYQPLLLMLLHPKSRCISAACAGGPPCAQVPWLLSWVPFSSGEVRAIPETEARKRDGGCRHTSSRSISYICKGLLGGFAWDGSTRWWAVIPKLPGQGGHAGPATRSCWVPAPATLQSR